MPVISKIVDKTKIKDKLFFSIYPIVIIICIPLLLVVNTVWNLRSFNRDANFLVRHQAMSIADTLNPFVAVSIGDKTSLTNILQKSIYSNSDILSAAILEEKAGLVSVYVKTDQSESNDDIMAKGLSQLAVGLGEPFAGLTYDPNIGRNTWRLIVPLTENQGSKFLLSMKIDTASVSTILERTTKDSLIVLGILVVVTMFLIANHFIFYLRSLRTKQLEELDKLKDEFISIAAHELRTPMTALIGYLELLKEKISPSEVEKIREDLAILNSVIADLNRLINDILDVSRIEQGRLKTSISEMDLNKVIKSVVDTLTPQANHKGLSISYSPAQLPMIKSDPDRVRQVITNLIGNSIKYTIKGGVEVSTKLKDKFIEVTVKDTGIGIPPDHIERLFSKFHRVQDEKTREVRGTGLGLWITKKIVEMLGGRIFAESIYGSGSSFTFILPLNG